MPKKLTSDQALELAITFRTLSIVLGDYRLARLKTKSLTKHQSQTIEDAEWSLLNHASDMTTMAVGLALDESTISFEKLKKSAAKAKKAVKTLKTVGKVIKVATTAISLAAAVMSKDPGAIAKNAQTLLKATTAEV